MRSGRVRVGLIMCFSLLSSPVLADKAPVDWDGLKRVASKRMDLVYLQPGADFRGYSKVMLDETEVSFHKSWRQDYNSTVRGASGRVSENDIQEALSKGVIAASDIFMKAWEKGGFTIVNQPGPDVLRVKTAVANISVRSPDVRTSGRSYTFSEDAGHATLVIEVRDSLTGALLGRAVDQDIAGDNPVSWRTSVSNRADFRDLVEQWAKDAVRGMSELRGLAAAK